MTCNRCSNQNNRKSSEKGAHDCATRLENKYNTEEGGASNMDAKLVAIGIFAILFTSSIIVVILGEEEVASESTEEEPHFHAGDPLFQGEGHDHMNASQHVAGTDNIEQLSFNPLTSPGNAEISVARSPDGRVYSYQAGWNDIHIVDVTNSSDPQVVGVYNDPNKKICCHAARAY